MEAHRRSRAGLEETGLVPCVRGACLSSTLNHVHRGVEEDLREEQHPVLERLRLGGVARAAARVAARQTAQPELRRAQHPPAVLGVRLAVSMSVPVSMAVQHRAVPCSEARVREERERGEVLVAFVFAHLVEHAARLERVAAVDDEDLERRGEDVLAGDAR